MNKKSSSRIKTVIISLIVIAALIGGMFGARAYVSSGKTTPVMQVMSIADTWIESGASGYGQISQGGTQMVYLDTSMLVSKIYVSQGDQVKEGDPLMQYDASQAKLQAESYRIRYEMARRDLKEARERLEYIKTFKPYVVPDPVYKIYKTRVNVLLVDDLSTDRFEADSIRGEGTKENPFVIDVNLNTEISREMMIYLLNYDEKAILPNTVPKVKPEPE
ncbi:MAG: biotin/lipoyl-binding protein, partial [Oscillospiraceae bacterium]|nr:biotin/lipoyl-binding protein [Oscillospiraceae bacterium]